MQTKWPLVFADKMWPSCITGMDVLLRTTFDPVLCSGQSVTLAAQANGPGTFDWTAENGIEKRAGEAEETLVIAEVGGVLKVIQEKSGNACSMKILQPIKTP